MTGFRADMVYVAIAFDIEGKVRDVALRGGLFSEVAADVVRESYMPRRAYKFGGAVIAAPLLSPAEVQTAVHNALFFPLKNSLGELLPDWQAKSWCTKRDGSFQRVQGGLPLTGPLGRTALTPAAEPF